MLIKRNVLEQIVEGKIDLAFRRWKRPTVRSGGRLRTAVGELAIDDVSIVTLDALTPEDARRSGFDTIKALRSELSRRSDGEVYRISLRFQGADQRIMLRTTHDLSDKDCADILAKIQRIGKRSGIDNLSLQILTWIGTWPERRAQDLANEIGLEKPKLKNHVRNLKELGLTESMPTGYKLSFRGKRMLEYAVELGIS